MLTLVIMSYRCLKPAFEMGILGVETIHVLLRVVSTPLSRLCT